jgi:hypothetical protein
MFRISLAWGLAISSLSTLALIACAGGGTTDGEGGADQDIVAGSVQPAFVGSYADKNQASQDFGSLELKADGRYVASVLTGVAKTKVLCNHAPCNVPEQGTWSVSHSSDGTDRLRIKPDDDNARIYALSKPVVMCITTPCPQPDGIRLDHGGSSQVLLRDGGSASQPTCESLGGQCRHSTLDVTFAANCAQDFGTTALSGACPAINQTCCSFTTAEPPHAQ